MQANQFRGVEYSAAVADFFNDTNLRPTATWHPLIKDVVYWGMDWLCPGYNQVLAERLQKYHGNLTAEITIHDILPVVQTGDLHIAVYDFPNHFMYVANARSDDETGPLRGIWQVSVRFVALRSLVRLEDYSVWFFAAVPMHYWWW